MNPRLRALLIAVVSILGMASGPVVWAQGVPDSIKTAEPSQVAPVRDFVSKQIARLKSDNAADQSAARDALVNEIHSQGSKESDSYVGIYCTEVGNGVKALMSEQSMRTRLNAAIVMAGLAKTAAEHKQLALLDAALAAMADKSDAVCLWGSKAARELAVLYFADPRPDKTPLAKALVQAVKDHPQTGAIADEVYAALTLDYTNNRRIPAATAQFVAGYVLDLLHLRLAMYQNGIPDEPSAERPAPGFFINQFTALTPDQQLQAVEAIHTLLSYAVQRGAAHSEDIPKLVDPVGFAARSLAVVDPAFEAVCKPFTNLSRTSNFQQRLQALPAIQNAIAASKFAAAKAPQTLR